jgi:hypothetical protein
LIEELETQRIERVKERGSYGSARLSEGLFGVIEKEESEAKRANTIFSL